MIEKMLKDKLMETKLMMSHGRRNEIRKHLDYYSGVSTEQYINNYFSGDAFSEIPPSLTNFTRKFINKISRIYSLGAKRNVSNNPERYFIILRYISTTILLHQQELCIPF